MRARALRSGALIAAMACGLAGALGADEVAVRSEVDARRVGVQDQVELTVTLEGGSLDGGEAVAVPPLQNLRVVGGPFVSTQVTFINGAVSQSKAYTYRLQPLAPGRAEVGTVHIKLAGGEKTAPPIAIEVVPGRLRPEPPSRQRGMLSDPFGGDPFESFFSRRRPRAEPKILVEASPSRTRLHVGEPLLLTYYLYTQESVTDLKFTTPPQYAGFWSEDLEGPESPPGGEPATIEGESYRRFAMTRKLLYPTRAGKLTIGAATVRLGLPRGFFFDGAAAVDRSTKPIEVAVDPLPVDRDFFGAVGRFRVSASLDRSSLGLGEAATVRFQVAGIGNLKWIDRAPDLSVPGAKVYPPQAKSELKPGPAGIEGTKTWEFVVVPETSGTLEIPALPFTYFDPSTETIARARTTPLVLQVAAGPGAGQSGAAVTHTAPAVPGALALRSDLELPARSLPIAGGRAVAWALVLVVALHGGLWAGSRFAERRAPVTAGMGQRRSVRSALRDLGRVGRGEMGKEAAAALIERTLHDVFGPMGDGAAASDRERAAREVLQEVHFIRYAPQLGDYTEKIREAAARAADVVRKWA